MTGIGSFTMPTLSFAALLPKVMDSEMKDRSVTTSDSSTVELPLHFDFDFELEDFDVSSASGPGPKSDTDEGQPRSPRTPTYTGGPSPDTSSRAPFEPDRFFKFPLISKSGEVSPLAALSCSPAAESKLSLLTSIDGSKENRNPDIPSPPTSPLLWIWTCHLCRSRYPLGATRRCLIDGHFYCSGDSGPATTQKNIKRKKRGQSCSSEFDYAGWQEWGRWKRQASTVREKHLARPSQKSLTLRSSNCQSCDYPSQCRYEKMNKIPDVIAAVSAKVVDRGHEDEVPTVALEKTQTDKVKTFPKVNTDLSETVSNDENEKQLSSLPSSDESMAIVSPDPVSPDLVDFSSMVVDWENGLEDAPSETEKSGDSVGDDHSGNANPEDEMEGVEMYGKADTTASSANEARLASREGREKKRPCVQQTLTQSQFRDFFRVTK